MQPMRGRHLTSFLWGFHNALINFHHRACIAGVMIDQSITFTAEKRIASPCACKYIYEWGHTWKTWGNEEQARTDKVKVKGMQHGKVSTLKLTVYLFTLAFPCLPWYVVPFVLLFSKTKGLLVLFIWVVSRSEFCSLARFWSIACWGKNVRCGVWVSRVQIEMTTPTLLSRWTNGPRDQIRE